MPENCKHGVWFQIESDYYGKPTKYQCKRCELIYKVKLPNKTYEFQEYFDTINSINLKIAENVQMILFLKFNKVVNQFTKQHIKHLEKENETFTKLLNQYIKPD